MNTTFNQQSIAYCRTTYMMISCQLVRLMLLPQPFQLTVFRGFEQLLHQHLKPRVEAPLDYNNFVVLCCN